MTKRLSQLVPHLFATLTGRVEPNAHKSPNLELHQPSPPPLPVSSAQEMSSVHPGLSNKGENTAKCLAGRLGSSMPSPWSFPSRHPCISSGGPKSRPRAVRRASCQGNRSAEILAALKAQLFKTSLHRIHSAPSIPSPLPREDHMEPTQPFQGPSFPPFLPQRPIRLVGRGEVLPGFWVHSNRARLGPPSHKSKAEKHLKSEPEASSLFHWCIPCAPLV